MMMVGLAAESKIKFIVSDRNATLKIVEKAERLRMMLNFKSSSKRMRCVFITK